MSEYMVGGSRNGAAEWSSGSAKMGLCWWTLASIVCRQTGEEISRVMTATLGYQNCGEDSSKAT
jgi:hypothetical protein